MHNSYRFIKFWSHMCKEILIDILKNSGEALF